MYGFNLVFGIGVYGMDNRTFVGDLAWDGCDYA